MTIPVQKTVSLTADGIAYDVEYMSPPVKEMVLIMDDFRQQEMDASIHLTMIRGALRDLQNQLLATIQQEQRDRETAAANQDDVDDVVAVAPTKTRKGKK